MIKVTVQPIGLQSMVNQILVTGNAFRIVMETYGYHNLEVIEKKQCERLKLLVAYFGGDHIHVHFMLYWGLIYQNIYRIERTKGISFHEIFARTVFGEKNLSPLPFVPSDAHWNAQEAVNTYGILPGHTVVLAPYANSFQEELSLKWWEVLAEELLKKGYVVVTNTSGRESEPVIPGTRQMFLPYTEFFRVLEVCGFLVGMRSGLFDLMSETNCKKVVIYQEFITRERMDFFSLKNMYGRRDVYEYKLINSSEGRAQLRDLILNEVFIEDDILFEG